MSVLNAEQKSAMMADLGLDRGSPPAESSGTPDAGHATGSGTEDYAGGETSSPAAPGEGEGTGQQAEGDDSASENKVGKSTQRRRRRRGRVPASALHGERRKRQAAQGQLSQRESNISALEQKIASLEQRLESSSSQNRESTSDDWLDNLLGEDSQQQEQNPQMQRLLKKIESLERNVSSNTSSSAENTFYAEVDEVLDTHPSLEDYFEDPEAVFRQAIQINPHADLYDVAKKSIEWYEAQEKRILDRHSKRQSGRPQAAPRLRPAGGSGVNRPEASDSADAPKGKGIKAISSWLRNRDQRRRKEDASRYEA